VLQRSRVREGGASWAMNEFAIVERYDAFRDGRSGAVPKWEGRAALTLLPSADFSLTGAVGSPL